MSCLKYLKHHEIDKNKWDNCIEEAVNCQPYALSWYLDVVSPNWEAFVVFGIDCYEGVLPLPVKFKIGLTYLQQPLFCQQLGFFSSTNAIIDQFLKQIVDQIKKDIRYSIDYTFNEGNSDFLTLNAHTSTQYLSLNRPYPEIYGNFNRDRKMNLRRGLKSNLKVERIYEINSLIQIFRQHTAHKVYGGVSMTAYRILENLFLELQKRDMVEVVCSKNHEGEIVTAAMFVVWKKKIIYLFSASTPEGRKANGNTLVITHILKKYAGRDVVLDFESPEGEFHLGLQGISGFSSSFGAEKVFLPQLSYNNLPWFIKGPRSVRVWVYKMFKV